jgi:DNA-binding NtrC family response regulator
MLSDYQLDGIVVNAMNGLETLDKVKEFNPETPVIMLSSQDKIEVAINCMHHKAFDYVVKSETACSFTKNYNLNFQYQKMQKN